MARRDHEKILASMINYKERGFNYIMEIMIDYDIKYLDSLEKGVVNFIYELIHERNISNDLQEKEECDKQIYNVSNMIYQLEDLQLYRDVIFMVIKPLNFKNFKKNKVVAHHSMTLKYYTVIIEIINHVEKLKKIYETNLEAGTDEKRLDKVKPFHYSHVFID